MKSEAHNSLLSYLREISPDKEFIYLDNQTLTSGDLEKKCIELKDAYPEIIDANCAIFSGDRETLALYLPALDYLCHDIFLQPAEISEDVYLDANVQFVISLGEMNVRSVRSISREKDDISELEEDKGYVLATSGTTGSPKLAKYSLSSLMATTQKNTDRGRDFIWGLTYDINRFAGLQVYLQCIASGSPLVIPKDSNVLSSVVDFYAEKGVNCLSATPSYWRKLLMTKSHKKINFKRITLGGEICSKSILDALTYSYPDSRVVHIYASTEAGVGFSVKDQKEGFPVDFLDADKSLGCELRINNGTLWIRNPNGSSKIVKGSVEVDSDGFINTNDLVIRNDNRILFLGRDSGSINVGGNKVMPEKIESVLEKSPHVSMARVFAKKNSVLGSLVTAELELTRLGEGLPSKQLKNILVNFCRQELEPFEIPALFKKVDSIKTNSTGKKIRTKT